jgi:hypothetical protein
MSIRSGFIRALPLATRAEPGLIRYNADVVILVTRSHQPIASQYHDEGGGHPLLGPPRSVGAHAPDPANIDHESIQSLCR